MNAAIPALVTVSIDGAAITVPEGTSIAAALAHTGSGRARLSVSGAARAPFCGMGVCHECRVQVDGVQQLACLLACQSGQEIRTDGVRLGSLINVPAHEPERSCDLLIAGAGPAGLQAALAAAPGGARITLLDDNPAAGGQVWRSGPRHRVPDAAQALLDALERHANVTLICGARVVARAGERALLVETATSGWAQRFDQLIVCTGARERLVPFPGWTLPGVTGAGGLQALIKQGLKVRGERIVIAGSGPLLLATAATARQAGARVLHVAEQAAWGEVARFTASLWRWPGKALQALTLIEPTYRAGSMALAAHGGECLQSVTLRIGGRTREVECERLACGFGLVARTRLAELMGCALGADGAIAVDEALQTSIPGIYAAGECTGIGGNERAQAQGRIAGLQASGQAAKVAALDRETATWERFAAGVQRHFALRPAVTERGDVDTLICRCEDVALGALDGCGGWVDAKLQTRCGMGPCQGRVCGTAVQALKGWTPTAPRQLTEPVRLATLAGVAHEQALASPHDFLDASAHTPLK